jgi:hypothetical protein
VSVGPELSSRYERYALLFDPDRSRLGHEALGLVERGVDPLYAGDLDEAHLLALQETGRVGALVVPGSLPLATLDALLERIASQLWAGPAAMVLVGLPEDRAALRAFADRGLRWVLREPYDAAEFRFVVSAALAAEDELDPRSGLRVPISMQVEVSHREVTRAGVARNLSIGGAYVALEDPPPPRTAITLRVGLGDTALELDASVVYCQAETPGRAVREAGMGLCFRALDDRQRTLVSEFIAERIGAFRL